MIGSGAFCMTEYIKGIEGSYTNLKHHIIFKNENNLFNLIKKWINNDIEREKIREVGYTHANKFHSYNKRVKDFINLISKK